MHTALKYSRSLYEVRVMLISLQTVPATDHVLQVRKDSNACESPNAHNCSLHLEYCVLKGCT
jgi:hypothetical protein